jgi:hypothetical protein
MTAINLNGGDGMIDGVAVTVDSGLRNANADGSTGPVTLEGLTAGGSELTGGDGTSTINGAGTDTINAGLGTTTISTGRGGSTVTLSSLGASVVTVASGGGDTIHAGLATVTITASGGAGDTIYAGGANLSLINGSAASKVYIANGYVLIQGNGGGSAFHADDAGSGQDAITVGGAADVIAIQSGIGGLDVIQGFRVGTDQLDLTGYAANAATLALQTQTADGTGGTLLHLADGTRLDFAGISHLTQAVFT